MRTLDHAQAQPAYWLPVLQNTLRYAFGAHDSGASSRPDPVKVSMGKMGHCASVAARRISGFEHLAHPLPLQNGAGGICLDTEPETMTTTKAGVRPASAAPSSHTPPHYLRRVAHSIVIRAAVNGRISWFVAFRMLALIDGGAA